MAKKVKNVFRSNSKGTSPSEFGLLKNYVAELKKSNPSSTVDLVTYDSKDGKTEMFRCI